MRKVVLSKRAEKKLDKLIDYLRTEWSEKVKSDFVKKLDKSLKQVCEFPDLCQKSDISKGLHMLIVTKQTSVFYRYDDKQIKVVTIFDNRMDPKKLNKEIK